VSPVGDSVDTESPRRRRVDGTRGTGLCFPFPHQLIWFGPQSERTSSRPPVDKLTMDGPLRRLLGSYATDWFEARQAGLFARVEIVTRVAMRGGGLGRELQSVKSHD